MTPQDKPQHNPSYGGGEHLLRKLIGGGAPKFPMVPDPSPTESSEREGAGSPSAPAATPSAGEPDSASNEAPLEVVTAYDKENAERFRRLKRTRWARHVPGIRGEWSETFYHQGNVVFSMRCTVDGRFWALCTGASARKIQAVVEATRKTCAEEVAAEAMQAVKDAGGPYVDMIDGYGDLDRRRFRAFQKVARQRSRQRRLGPPANVGQPAAVASEPTVPSCTPAAPQPSVQVFPVFEAPPEVPKDAVFLCKSDFPGDLILIKEEVTLYLHRADGKDTLWITSIERAPFAVGPVPTEGDVGSAGMRLVDTAMRTNWYFGCPEGEFVAGTVTKEQLYGTWELIQLEKKRIRDQIIAEMGDRPLVALARELRLGPEPTGSNRASWVANCPGTNHFLCIQAESGEFGCGYCKVKGGLQELRDFVASRGRTK